MAGRSLSDFIVSPAQGAAVRTIHDHELLRLNGKERAAFVKALLKPPAPSQRMKKAAKTYQLKMGV